MAAPAPKKKKLSRLEARREERNKSAAGGGGGSSGVGSQVPGTPRHVLIGREVLVYLAEQEQMDVDDFDLFGFWNRRGSDSVCPTTGKVTSPAEMPYLSFIARLFHGVEATSCQAERNFSALAHLIGDLRSSMLAGKVEQMMFIWLNRHFVNEVRELDAAVEQARARVAKSAQKSVAAQEKRSNIWRLTLHCRSPEWSWGWYALCVCPPCRISVDFGNFSLYCCRFMFCTEYNI